MIIKNIISIMCICFVISATGCSSSLQNPTSTELNQENLKGESIMESNENYSEIYLAGGCFWGTEAYMKLLPGVIDTEVGYANGNTENPTYEDVCRKNTGFAEAVKVIYDTEIISTQTLLKGYFETINPISVDRQGNDVGSQYRTGIYYVDEVMLKI